jgi:DNA repair exonuclease SbcCD ATPase subunit
MKLKRLEIKKLYGTFTKSVNFDERLNLLVGINGSGKTSILNCIDWLLKPDLPRLASTNFISIRLILIHNGNLISIHAEHEPGRLVISEEN